MIRTAPPIRIVIPAIGVDSPVIPVGVTSSGILDTPHDFVQAGWYENGTIPGNMGSAVIDAHVDSGGYHPRIPGVFKRLKDLKAGDDVLVVESNGSEIRFTVVDSKSYAYAAVPTTDLFEEHDGAYLKLITCAGTWDPAKGTYDDRLIVRAKLATS